MIDGNNLFFKEVLEYYGREKDAAINSGNVRRICASALSRVCRNFKSYGEVVLANDSRSYWRKDVFPHYKASRKAGRDNSFFDWNKFFPCFDEFKEELRESFPVKFLEVKGAEADDIIAVLSLRKIASEPVLIWSSDTDDLQLQIIAPEIKQYSYVKKKIITPKSEKYSLFEHVVKGDAGDGVPNILSPNSTFVDKIRQKSVSAAKMLDWELHGLSNPEAFCATDDMLRRFHENRTMVDYKFIPEKLASEIVEAYESTKIPRGKIFNYLVKNGLTNIMQDGGF